jgi:hypothetical protein
MFDSNGAGLAIGDLDNDGDQDIVFANLKGPNVVFWNEGAMTFRKQEFPHGGSRAVAVVDVDGDGWLDIIFTQRLGALAFWHNTGKDQASGASSLSERFVEQALSGVLNPAYAMAWGDLDRDGDLDLVTGSYDAELEKELRDTFLFSGGAGVFYYENRGGTFVAQRLAAKSQALTIALFDVNADGWLDIIVGNDFATQDQVWLHSATGWQAAQPFAATTHSTMSLTAGDINNDGQDELFATDMKPYTDDPQTQAAWMPVMEGMHDTMMPGDPQVMENVLQVRQPDGSFQNQAARWGVDATGWSWSTRFGDLDNDGRLDLYVVNGMATQELFGHLPDSELVEENQAFRNDGSRFVPAPNWGLGVTAGGRGMSMADLDSDGDLDIVVNNLMAPAVVFENQLCAGAGLEVDLRWPAGANTRGLGARLTLYTSTGTLTREARAVAGYASGDPARVHFGFPRGSDLQRLDFRWPDGTVSSVSRPKSDTLLTVSRSQGGETPGATQSVAVTVEETPLNAPAHSAAPAPTSTLSAPAAPPPQPVSPAPTAKEGAAAADFDAAVPTAWFNLMYDLVRDEKMVPPLASRLFGYAGVTLYEAAAPGISGARSLAGQLNELQPLPQPASQAEYYWPMVANTALATLLRTMLVNTSGNTQRAIVDLERQFEDQFAATVAPEVLQRSEGQGQLIGLAIFDWAQADGYAHLNNCAYTPPSGTGLWEPTPPGFAAPLQPCWGQMRPFVLQERSDECQPSVQPTYSEDVTAQFYFEALEVYRTAKNLTPRQQEIARYWSDDAGKTGTPPGHSIAILTQLIHDQGLSLAVAAEAYARLSIALADSFVSCWQTKFVTNVPRPIAYIQKVIDPAWTSPLTTPPFPEYTSGHSVQSGATATVLTDLFGEDFAFTDHTHDTLGYTPRSFKSFFDMAEEAAISRLYGGIHYRSAIDVGIDQGKCIGRRVDTLKFHD